MKMRFSLLFLFICTLQFPVMGQVAGHCEQLFYEYGSGKGDDHISSECVSWSFEQADYNAIRNSNDGKLKGLGHNTFLVIENAAGEKSYIAGVNTMLSDVRAIRFHEQKNLLYVLASMQGKVFVFDLSIPGNVGPQRILSFDEIVDADDIDVSRDGSEVYILHSKQKQVLVLDGTRNLRGRKELRDMRLVREHSFTGFDFVSFAHDRVRNSFYYLDRNSDVYDHEGKKLDLVLTPDQKKTAVRSLEWNSLDKALEGRNRLELVFKVGR